MINCAITVIAVIFFLLLGSRFGSGEWLYQSEGKWDQQWASGEWDYMDKVAVERSKNAAIGGVLVQMYSHPNASLLDVGCGVGAISDFLLPEQKLQYVGVDLSKEAILRAKVRRTSSGNNMLKFVHSSVYDFKPIHNFDVIVFSDVLYYVDHEKVLEKYRNYLKPKGLLIISIFSNSYGKVASYHEPIFITARKLFAKIDELDIGGYTKKGTNAQLEKTAFHLEVFRFTGS
jgi:2-polyprenyl-3-methyl-5-hydroxy-6-metoxy-1,4-benzoquinol methylase